MNYDFNNILGKFSKFNFYKTINHIKAVTNLTYYIALPIINNLLLNPYISEMTIMVQKEVSEIICAFPNGKDFSILTLACNNFANTEMIMLVSKK